MKLDVQKLSVQEFSRFGSFADLLHPENHDKVGEAPGGFYRDMLQISLNNNTVSCSISQVYPKPFELKEMEYHDSTGEGMLPLNEDAVICFAPASLPNMLAEEEIRAFHVPRGTLLTIRPGVWHCAAFPCGNAPLNMLVILPERVYATDCKIMQLKEGCISIVFP